MCREKGGKSVGKGLKNSVPKPSEVAREEKIFVTDKKIVFGGKIGDINLDTLSKNHIEFVFIYK